MKIILMVLSLFQIAYFQAQCSFVAPTGDCSSGCTSTLASGSNVNGGQVYCYTGSGTLNNINLNGGTIRVCGNLTINNLNINSGVLIVTITGTLTIPQNKFFNGNVQLINYGVVNFNGNLTLQNSNNYIYNDNTYNQTGKLTLNSSTSYFINDLNHTATINNLHINSGVLCLEDNSVLNLNSLTNNQNNTASFSSVSGNACVKISTSAQVNAGSFSTAPEIGVCLANGITVNGGGGWGGVSLFNNCNSCSAPLSIQLINFSATQLNKSIKLIWSTASEINNDYFTIERSKNGIEWKPIETIKGEGNSSSILNYTTTDLNPYIGTSYYRLKQTDFDGKYKYLDIQVVNFEQQTKGIIIYPNPTENQITIIGNKSELETITIYNVLGQDVTHKTTIENANYKIIVNLTNLTEGTYYIRTKTTANKMYKQ